MGIREIHVKTEVFRSAHLYELRDSQSVYELDRQIEDFLLYGMYPAVICAETAALKQRVLLELTGAYLLKDILELDRVKSSKILSLGKFSYG